MNLNLQIIDQQNAIPEGGRIKYFKQNWQRNTKDPVILNTVQGISLESITYPIQKKIPNLPNLNLEQRQILRKEILDLEQKSDIIRGAPLQDQYISIMFTVQKKDGGFRPIINLRPLNVFPSLSTLQN